jgi:hypothetical protein
MKKIMTLQAILMVALYSAAQTNASHINWGGTGNSYLPYHQYLQQQFNQLQRSNDGARNLVYKQIAYSQDVWDVNKEQFNSSDSGLFVYTNQGWATSYTTYSFTQSEWGGYIKLTYTYDASGNQLSYLNQYWDNNSDRWINSSLFSNTYDGAGHTLTALTQTWNSEAASWINVQNVNYVYNSNGNQTQQTIQTWDLSNNSWSNVNQVMNTYDANNRLTATVTQAVTGGSWNNVNQTLNTYDNSGNLLTETNQTWNGSAWVNYTLVTNTYNPVNGLLSSLSQAWQNNNWLNYALTDNIFDGNYNQIQHLGLNWNTQTDVWDTSTVNIYTYNSANKILTETDYVNSPAGFLGLNQYVYTYDGNNNNTQYESFQSVNNAWVPQALYQYNYDADNNPVYEQYQAYNLQTSSLQPQNQYYFYYQSFEEADPSSITSVSQNDFGATLYPNPATGSVIFINLTTDVPADMTIESGLVVNIYDMNGRIVNAGTMPLASGSHRIELGNAGLASGTYFVQLIDRSGNKTSVLPFVKQ